MFNGLATAYDFKQQGEEVTVRFQGAGKRWISELTKAEHPAHDLFEAVKDTVAGVSCGCADVFGANEEVEKVRVRPNQRQSDSRYFRFGQRAQAGCGRLYVAHVLSIFTRYQIPGGAHARASTGTARNESEPNGHFKKEGVDCRWKQWHRS